MKKQNLSNKEQNIIDNIDRAITELVYDKTQIVKAYNYYHAKRDPEQFRHLEENYGIGTPTSVEFVPLVKKHIDVLIGEYISTPILPKVSCKDKETITNIQNQKSDFINKGLAKELNIHLKNTIENAINSKGNSVLNIEDLIALQKKLEGSFISDYEIAGQNIVDYSMISRNLDFANKRKILLTDLLVSGTAYYQVIPSSGKTNVVLRVLNPVHTFIDRNPESPYLNQSYRAVIRNYYTKDQILNKYGHLLKKEDLSELDDLDPYAEDGSTTTYLRSYENFVASDSTENSNGILGGFEITSLLPFERNTSKYFRLYPVYEVEWLQTDKEDGEYITNRYEGVRISHDIYIPTGKSPNVVRSMDSPRECTLSINGMFYSDRNGDPFSLIIATANLQDKFDCLNFYRDNIIAESGSVGDWVDVAHLPKFLGADVTERLMKWKAYKKSGVALYDSSQEGEVVNTSFNGFDDTIKLQTIQAIDLAIQRVEETTSTITGVFREKLGGIEQRDAVSNIQVGVTQSSYITKQYYQIMDLLTRETLIDVLNISKIVFKKGISGTIILGEKLNKIFTALPEHYSFTDFDIHITDSSEIKKEQEIIRQLTTEMSKGGQMDPEIIIEVATASGLTKMKAEVLKAIGNKRKENNQLQQLTNQVQQYEQQLKELQQELSKSQQQIKTLNSEKIALEREKLEFDKELGWYKEKGVTRFNDSKLELDKKRVELEALQLLDLNPKNDEIKNN